MLCPSLLLLFLPLSAAQFYNVDEGFYISRRERAALANRTADIFYRSYDAYLNHAFPLDELNPHECSGRGSDREKPDNININDVLGDYSLTLIDVLDSLIVFRNVTELRRAAELVRRTVTFNHSATVQLFEATIRVLGGLISAENLLHDPLFSSLTKGSPDTTLLPLIQDLAPRLFAAFKGAATGLPFPRVNLADGVPANISNETCLAGAGTLLLEFSEASRLTGDERFAAAAKMALRTLFSLRNETTGLPGFVLDVNTGVWTNPMSGLGAGMDSFYEYLLKGYIATGDKHLWEMYDDLFAASQTHNRVGRERCTSGRGATPWYHNVDNRSGNITNTWIDSLQAAWPSVLLLHGRVDEAVCQHLLHYLIWRKYSLLPERFNWALKEPDYKFYPLRPELMESTYFLYRATKNPFYLAVGRDLLTSLETHTTARCGHATIHDVTTMEQEDRMESFFLSETCKYLYLLFDEDNPVNELEDQFLFTTEGHLVPLKRTPDRWVAPDSCEAVQHLRHGLPLKRTLFQQAEASIGLSAEQSVFVA